MSQTKPEWYQYQEEVADVFRELEFYVKTNETLQGTRTTHDVDVVVRSNHAGFDATWLIECKYWKRKVSKEQILTLRAVVDDIGAEKGFVSTENGFQSGALAAARNTNIELVSLGDLREIVGFEIGKAKLWSIFERANLCADRYWELDKDHRIEQKLRPESGDFGYSGYMVFRAVEFTARQALLRGFPISYDRISASILATTGSGRDIVDLARGTVFSTPEALIEVLCAEIEELEHRLNRAETGRP